MYVKMTTNYHQKHKEKLWKEARERYQNLSQQKKIKGEKKQERYQNLTEEEKKLQYHCERNKNLTGNQKKKVVEYRINYYIRHNK